MSELTQLDSVKSMIRYLPPKGTAGFARSWERIERRSPSPPARITAIVRFTPRMLARAFGTGHQRVVVIALARGPGRPPLGRPGGQLMGRYRKRRGLTKSPLTMTAQ